MTRIFALALVVLLAEPSLHAQQTPTAPSAQQGQSLSLATAATWCPSGITVTGRVAAVVSARISARVSGHIAQIGKDASGQLLDAGMKVKAGDELFRLDETTFRNGLAIRQTALASAQAMLENVKAHTREERIDQLRQALAELKAQVDDKTLEEQRYRRLVEQDKTLPARRLEEVQTQLRVLQAMTRGAEARLREAENGATSTELAVAEAHVNEAQAALKASQDDLRDSVVKAPFDGTITQRFKSPGDYVATAPITDVFEVVSMDKLEAQLSLPEAYFNSVQAEKSRAVLRCPLLKGDLDLPIARVVSDIDIKSGTFPVRVTIPADQSCGLIPGAFVTADVVLNGQDASVLVPIRAVVQNSDDAVVFVAQDGKMVRREVSLGDRLTESIIVKRGLACGEKVIVGPAEMLKDGAALPESLRSKP